LWGLRGDLRWATKWASRTGAAFGLLLIGLGILVAVTGALVQGLWWFLIGMFIRAAAVQSYQQLEVTRLMRGVKAEDVMAACPLDISRDMTVRDFVEQHVYERQQAEFPVCENGRLVGIVGIRQIKDVPSSEWDEKRLGDIMIPADQAETVEPDEDAVDALRKLQASRADALVVARGGTPVGILSASGVMNLLNLKMDLETG
ncbi:MAG: CBS domain-containing protein, partial [Alphaproteobacteria bacterium]